MNTQVFLSLFVLVTVSFLSSSTMADTKEKRIYHEHEAESLFDDFLKEHSKQYKDEDEKQQRFNIFKDNLKKINEMNKANSGAVFGINKFTDLTKEEMRGYTGGLSKP